MNYTYPESFDCYDSWVEYSENARREWEKSKAWERFTPEKWMETFPEMRTRVEELQLNSYHLLDFYEALRASIEATFSKDLNTRLIEEALLESTLDKAIQSRKQKIKTKRRMLSVFNPISEDYKITEEDITRARDYPMEELLPEVPKRNLIRCPFHEEKTPSCHVYSTHIHCYGCGKHLDPISYIMETQGKTFIDSVKYLCKL